MSKLFYVRYFSFLPWGTYWNMEIFKNEIQAKNYAKIVNGSVFIKLKINKTSNEFFKKI